MEGGVHPRKLSAGVQVKSTGQQPEYFASCSGTNKRDYIHQTHEPDTWPHKSIHSRSMKAIDCAATKTEGIADLFKQSCLFLLWLWCVCRCTAHVTIREQLCSAHSLPPPLCGSRNWTRASRLAQQVIYLMNNPAGPTNCFCPLVWFETRS